MGSMVGLSARALLLGTFAFAPLAAASCNAITGCNALTGLGDLQIGGSASGGGAAAAGGAGAHGGVGAGASGAGGSGTIGGGGTGTGGGTGACSGVGCSGHGSCAVGDGGVATCVCLPGYHDVGLECLADETCDGLTCGRCAACAVIEGVATCECPTGLVLSGGPTSDCTTSPDPCEGVDCGPDGFCVAEAHCMPLGACVPTCDCSNCGNCGPDNSDGRWDDWQEHCGNLMASPATMACTKPCPNAGDGCLPYSPGICWGMEGCFSL